MLKRLQFQKVLFFKFNSYNLGLSWPEPSPEIDSFAAFQPLLQCTQTVRTSLRSFLLVANATVLQLVPPLIKLGTNPKTALSVTSPAFHFEEWSKILAIERKKMRNIATVISQATVKNAQIFLERFKKVSEWMKSAFKI